VARLVSLIVVAGVLVPIAARAQSVRYPPDAADADREAEARSHLWESALDPERQPYDELVRQARRALEEQNEHGTQIAVDKLTEAIKRLPKDPRAYGWRGEAYLALRDWPHCAEDLAAAEERAPEDSPDHDRQELDLGICLGRAGRYPEAERTLAHAVERKPRGETWMRLGEVRIALGKLDEAIDALTAALDTNEGNSIVTHWLLASAYDRARRPTNAEAEAQLALSRDVTLSVLVNPIYAWLGRGELEYLMGLAYSTMPAGVGSSKPEYALLYFRRFLAASPDSPWKRRVDEHVRALVALAFPQWLIREGASTAIVDLATVRPALEHAMPALRACLAKQPTAAYEISIVKDGPRTPDSALDRPHYAMPPPGAKIELKLDVGAFTATAVVDDTRKCFEPILARLVLPVPKDRDTWYRVQFDVIGP
jgi:tetratricopeptide (TPR) repeat protein